jgi:hypothetical protein
MTAEDIKLHIEKDEGKTGDCDRVVIEQMRGFL